MGEIHAKYMAQKMAKMGKCHFCHMAKVTFAIWPCFAILAGGFSGVGVKMGKWQKIAKMGKCNFCHMPLCRSTINSCLITGVPCAHGA